MTASELAEYLSKYGSRNGGNSFWGQGATANAQLRALSDVKGELDSGLFDATQSALAADRNSAIAGGVTAGLGGLTEILGGAFTSAKNDDSVIDRYQNEIDDINAIGNNNYSSFNQLASDYSRLDGFNADHSLRDIRGMSDGQKVGNIATSTLSGAAAGTAVLPGWGTLAGAVVGLGAGLGGVFAGDAIAKKNKERLDFNARMALNNASSNLNAASEGLRDYQFRSGVSNRAAYGGQVQRKQMSLKEFADKITANRRSNEITRSAGFVRQHCKGGTMVRIKVK